ncbi:MAG: helix-turn-helix transcriptional regulator [Elusimicrobia bacterium]|nr:helix-turn-helix transcriptional regulator [Elusimicrobiota bacterium]
MTTVAIGQVRRQSEILWALSKKRIESLSCSLNDETARRSDLLASSAAAPAICRRARRRVVVHENPGSVLAWAIGQRVRAARERQDWRQEDLARESGIARANVARLETGRVVPKLPTLERVARALGLKTQDLVKTPAAVTDKEDMELAESGLDDWSSELERLDKAAQ